MTETIPKKAIPIAVSFVLIFDQFINQIVPTSYFVWISQSWFPLYASLLVLISLPQVILVWFLPESPVIYYE